MTIVNYADDMGFKQMFKESYKTFKERLNPYFGHEVETMYKLITLARYNHHKGYVCAMLEFTGLAKSFGHPDLNIAEGLAKVKKHRTAPTIISEELRANLGAGFKRLFCSHYFEKYKKWPVIKHVPPDSSLKPFIDSNTWPYLTKESQMVYKD